MDSCNVVLMANLPEGRYAVAQVLKAHMITSEAALATNSCARAQPRALILKTPALLLRRRASCQ